MRPLFAVILCVGLIGGVFAYSSFTDSIRPPREKVQEARAAGTFDLEVVCTFDARGDEFGTPALQIKFIGTTLFAQSELIPAGHRIRLDNVAGLKVGRNDVFVLATPAAAELAGHAPGDRAFSLDAENADASRSTGSGVARAIHIRVYRDRHVIAEKTIWSEIDGPISDLVLLNIDHVGGHQH